MHVHCTCKCFHVRCMTTYVRTYLLRVAFVCGLSGKNTHVRTYARTAHANRQAHAYVSAYSSTSIFTSFQGEERLPEKHVIPIVDVDKWTWRQTSCMSPQKGKAFALHVHCTCKCPLCTACPRYVPSKSRVRMLAFRKKTPFAGTRARHAHAGVQVYVRTYVRA